MMMFFWGRVKSGFEEIKGKYLVYNRENFLVNFVSFNL